MLSTSAGVKSLDRAAGLAAIKAPLAPEEFKRSLLKWVVGDDQPFTAVESERFRSLFSPDTMIPSADTIKREIMKCYREEADRIGDRLCNAGSKISLTLDCWTSPSTQAFMGITAHYIDHAWIPHSLVLDFIPLDGAHAGEDLCEALFATCERFNILPKLLGIATDNASNIDKLLDCFESACLDRGVKFDREQQHMRCTAHITNLAVQALLRELGTEPSSASPSIDEDTTTQAGKVPCVAKLRRIVVKIRSSPQRRNTLKGQCGACGIGSKKLILDVRVRWNSTYAMIERACELRIPLSNLTKLNPDLPELSDEEWELLGVVARLLSIFDQATRALSATEYPTLNRAVPIYNYLFNKLEDFRDACDGKASAQGDAAIIDQCSPVVKDAFSKAIKAAHDKLCTYYGKTWADMYAIAVILDPRLKADYYMANKWGQRHITHAKDGLLRAVEAYATDEEPRSSQADDVVYLQEMDQEIYQSPKRRRVGRESEMRNYLATDTASPGEDILEWWKHHSGTYPCLARIARDYLAIPATSVPAERVFSGGADLITDKRGSLNEDTIQACMCLRSWL